MQDPFSNPEAHAMCVGCGHMRKEHAPATDAEPNPPCEMCSCEHFAENEAALQREMSDAGLSEPDSVAPVTPLRSVPAGGDVTVTHHPSGAKFDIDSIPVVVHPTGTVEPLEQWARGDAPRSRAAQILTDAATTVGAGGDRHSTYGDAADNFTAIGKLWSVVLGVESISAEQVALCMNQVKVARLTHSIDHRDSWVDGCGYLALGGDIAGTPGRHRKPE